LEYHRRPYIEHADSEFHITRRKAIRDDLALRLRNACSHLSDEEFSALVDQMAECQLRSERRVILE
jgi:hypothetical protein